MTKRELQLEVGIMNKKITKIYLQKEVQEQMQYFFENENFIQLNNFFNEKYINLILNKIEKSKFKQKYNPIKYKFK